jgi:hypothetical protein
LRPAQSKLVLLTEPMSDTEIDDVVRAVKVLLRVGKRTLA